MMLRILAATRSVSASLRPSSLPKTILGRRFYAADVVPPAEPVYSRLSIGAPKEVNSGGKRVATFINSLQRRLNVFGMESVPRLSRTQASDNLSSRGNIAGYRSLLELARLFSSAPKGFEKYMPGADKDDKSSKEPSSDSEKGSGDKKPKQNGGVSIGLGVLTTSLGLLYLYTLYKSGVGQAPEITWQQFYTELLSEGRVERLVVSGNTVTVYLKDKDRLEEASVHEGEHHQTEDDSTPQTQPIPVRRVAVPSYRFTIGSVDRFEESLYGAQRDLGVPPEQFIPVDYVRPPAWTKELPGILVSVGLIAVLFFLMRSQLSQLGGKRGGIFKFGKSSPVVVTRSGEVGTTFSDVAGLIEAKAEVMEFVSFLNNPSVYTALGARIPKGALLSGPPGCGKTLLARAVAGEAKVPFLSVSGSDFVEMFVGVGPSRVRDLFAQARSHAPCILFIDEIDAVGRARGRNMFAGGGNDERENTLNQLLVEMDGFTPNAGVVILAGTNRSDVLDKALLRPGRFDRLIVIDKPDISGREQIFAVHLKPLKMDIDRDEVAKRMAALTPNFSGADIASVCNEAALLAARRGANAVEMVDFDKAIDRVVGGIEKKTRVLPPEEKRIVAHHEAGHATASWFLEHAAPLMKVSIIPRAQALGYAQYLPKEDFITTKEQLDDLMCVALGGRVAEEIIFGSVTSGAQDDLDKVTKIAQSAVQLYGMSDALGPLSFPAEPSTTRPFSEATARLIDMEIKDMITRAHKRTTEILNKNKDGLLRLAEMLMTRESVDHNDVITALGPRPFPIDPRMERLMSLPPKAPAPTPETLGQAESPRV